MQLLVARSSSLVTPSDTALLPEKASYLYVENSNAAPKAVKIGFQRSPGAPIEDDTFMIEGKACVFLFIEAVQIFKTGTDTGDITVHALHA